MLQSETLTVHTSTDPDEIAGLALYLERREEARRNIARVLGPLPTK